MKTFVIALVMISAVMGSCAGENRGKLCDFSDEFLLCLGSMKSRAVPLPAVPAWAEGSALLTAEGANGVYARVRGSILLARYLRVSVVDQNVISSRFYFDVDRGTIVSGDVTGPLICIWRVLRDETGKPKQYLLEIDRFVLGFEMHDDRLTWVGAYGPSQRPD